MEWAKKCSIVSTNEVKACCPSILSAGLGKLDSIECGPPLWMLCMSFGQVRIRVVERPSGFWDCDLSSVFVDLTDGCIKNMTVSCMMSANFPPVFVSVCEGSQNI